MEQEKKIFVNEDCSDKAVELISTIFPGLVAPQVAIRVMASTPAVIIIN